MKSKKQRRIETKVQRVQCAAVAWCPDPRGLPQRLPSGWVLADRDRLLHNNLCGGLPRFYVDIEFTCRDCGRVEVWAAKRQKWWYENAQGSIHSRAVRCRSCRALEHARAAEARRVSMAGMAHKLAQQAGQ